MTTSGKKDDVNQDLETMFSEACNAFRWSEVLEMYKEKKELRIATINTWTGDTALHMAVSRGKEYVVKAMVNLVCGNIDGQDNNSSLTSADENGGEKKLVLEAKNAEGNTPLHLAASNGNVEMSKILGHNDTASIAIPNMKGETPLFLSVVSGNSKKAFLWLYHYLHEDESSSTDFVQSIRRDDGDTILHWALEEKRTDLAIEIVLHYKDYLPVIVLMKNKDGLSPLHVLATTPTIFKSAYDRDQPIIARLLYKLTFIRVKEKKATTQQELKKESTSLIDFDDLIVWLIIIPAACYEFALEASLVKKFVFLIVLLLCFLGFIMITPIAIPVLVFIIMYKKIRGIKEQHTWSLQLVEELLKAVEDKVMSENPYKVDGVNGCIETEPSSTQKKEAESSIVETPLMIAAKNGIIEMVDKFQKRFPGTMSILNEEGKNIVLIAAETRQTHLYKFLTENKEYKDLFGQVDREGNTALHLAVKPEVRLNWQTITMMDEYKWLEFVKSSLPPQLREKYNNEDKTADDILRDNYKDYINSDRQWLNQTSQTCSLASTLVAGMAFSNFAGENINRKNNPSLVALSLSLTSTISFLAILSYRSLSLHFWRYVPFMLLFAILTMFGSIVALWTSLMLSGQFNTFCAILGLPIVILTIGLLRIFIGPVLSSMLTKIPAPSRNTAGAIRYLKPQKNNNGRPRAIQAHLMNKRRHTDLS